MTNSNPIAVPVTTTGAPTLNGQVIGQVATATRGVFDRYLAGVGATFQQWVALNQLDAAGGRLPRAELIAGLATLLQVDPDVASATVDATVTAGHTRPADDDPASLVTTPAGDELHATITVGIATIARRLYGDLPAEELATTARILATVTDRARAELGG